MQKIYCIPGLGADENVFGFLDLSFVKPVFIKWTTPLRNETLEAYALRLRDEFIPEDDPVIFGLSLGGMIAVEMAKSLPLAKVIIISSAKTKKEIPFRWKIFQHIPLYKILPLWAIKGSLPVQFYFIGAQSNAGKAYVKEMLEKVEKDFYRWAVAAILTWQNRTIPLNVKHIHGTHDRMLPFKGVSPHISIAKGGHLMIIEKAEEVSDLLKRIICTEC